jgi:hypothetical protein
MTTVKTIEKIDAREIRRKLGLNQQQFWSTLGVTQFANCCVWFMLNRSTSKPSSAKTGKWLSI